jgi:glycerol-3-phosphate dehydrogenase
VGWPEDDNAHAVAELVSQAAQGKLPEKTCLFMAERYGTRGVDIAKMAIQDQRMLAPLVDSRPEILALVDWAVNEELAQTVTDVMERRTQLFFRDRNQGLGAVEKIAQRMKELLGWSEPRKVQEIIAYQAEVEMSRRWKDEIPLE